MNIYYFHNRNSDDFFLDLESNALNILKLMAKQEFADKTAGNAQEGYFSHIKNPNNLRYEMGTFYDHFSSKNSNVIPTFMTVPYFDAFGLGVITSICKSVNVQKFVGVTCVDVSITDLLEDVEFFQTGQSSYAFLLDLKNRTIIHPLLPRPAFITDDPSYVNFDQIEHHLPKNNLERLYT